VVQKTVDIHKRSAYYATRRYNELDYDFPVYDSPEYLENLECVVHQPVVMPMITGGNSHVRFVTSPVDFAPTLPAVCK